jgi:hypothetical protein
MKTISLLSTNQSIKRNVRKSIQFRQSLQEALLLEDLGLNTTDVTFVSQSAQAAAIKKGAGVMIGDYFVGVTTGSDLLYSHPVIVY